MKNNMIFFLGGVFFTMVLSFQPLKFEPGYATAEVSKIDGYYIFTDGKPVMAYDTLGVVELGFVSGTQYESIRNNLIKRAIKKYPNGNGLILQLNRSGLDKGVVIKFR